MTFDPLAEKEKSKRPSSREDELVRAVFSGPQGRELLQIWKDKLVYTATWDSLAPEATCRQLAGRFSVYRDIIKIAERKPNDA